MTGEEYTRALERIEVLMSVDPAPDSLYGKELDRIATMVQEYERKHFGELFRGSMPQEGFDAAD